MKKIWNKLKKVRAGFTLAETLIVVLILLIVSAIVGAAIPSAANVFAKTVDSANAQVLLSTTMTVLRDEFSTVKEISSISTTEVSYKNDKGNRKLQVVPKSTTYGSGITGPGIWVYPQSEAEGGYGSPFLLVSAEAATSGMYVTLALNTDVSDGVVKMTGIQVLKDGYGKPLAAEADYSVRIIGKAVLPTPAPAAPAEPPTEPPTEPPDGI